MAGSFSDFLEDKLLKHVLTNTSYTSPTTIYVALFTTAATDATAGTEVSGGSYARQTASFTVSGTGTQAVNSSAIEFPAATANWGTITHVGLYDASSSGNYLAWADLTTSRTINDGDVLRIPASSLTVSLS